MRLPTLAALVALSALVPSAGWLAIVPAAVTAPIGVGEEEIEHYPNGEVELRCPLDREGRRNGAYREYHENGKTRVKARYKRGVLTGRYESFHPDGKRWITSTYDKKGALHGKYVVRHADGKTILEGRYELGRRQGNFELKVRGKVASRQEWADDVLLRVDGILLYPKSLESIWKTLERIDDPKIVWAGKNAALLEDSSGKLTEDSGEYTQDRQLALRRLMAYRYLCDVPWKEMELSPRYNYHTTIGSKLLEEMKQLTHWP